MMNRVIIDTSAWIESFRPKHDAPLGRLVKDLVMKNQVLMPGIIMAELLRGTKTKNEYNRLKELLRGLAYLPVPEDFWDRLSEFSFSLFRKGVAVPLMDTYIALLCIEQRAALLHRDKHYDWIAKKSPLKILT
jgi:predicted nucleic acid-binding protein